MARYTGKNARLYVALTSGGVAVPAVFIKEWEHNASFDAIDVTCFEDDNMTYVAGLADASGSYAGYLDNATAQTYTASIDGGARAFYFYPDITTPTKYTYGTAIFSWTGSYSKTGAAEMSGNWNAAGAVTKLS